MKFEVGDRVRIKDNLKNRLVKNYAGKNAIVKDILRGSKWPYRLEMDGGDIRTFHANELERHVGA